jgi:hypothetical protein
MVRRERQATSLTHFAPWAVPMRLDDTHVTQFSIYTFDVR